MDTCISLGMSRDNDCTIRKPVREMKGKSLLVSQPDFVAIDIETTGFSSLYDEIIELAGVRFRDDQAVEFFSTLVKPEDEISEFITELTGITNEMVKDAPSLEDALPEFMAFIGHETLVGHNVSFDVNFIYDVCDSLGYSPLSNNFIDTMRLSRRLFPDWPKHRLKDMVEFLNLSVVPQHRASGDAQLAGEGYVKLRHHEKFENLSAPRVRTSLRAQDIHGRADLQKEDSPLFGAICVFTGKLDTMQRREAMQKVADVGGICGDNVTKDTNYLILGNNDYCKSIKDGKSNKLKKAEKLILAGQDLQIIPESTFLDMLLID